MKKILDSFKEIQNFLCVGRERSHNGIHNGKMWIFVTQNIFFSILKEKRIKFFVHNFRNKYGRARKKGSENVMNGFREKALNVEVGKDRRDS